MTRLTVIGGTGYAGSNIVAKAQARGLETTSWSRGLPAEQLPGVTYRTGDVQDPATLEQAVSGADVIIGALSPRGALDGHLREVYRTLAGFAEKAGVRLGIIGGAGSLLVAEGGPTLASLPTFPAEVLPEATQLAEVLEDLRAHQGPLDWFFVSPAAAFGAFNPGTEKGTWRIGGDVLLSDAEGNSEISGQDFASALVDEVTTPTHHRQRFSVAC